MSTGTEEDEAVKVLQQEICELQLEASKLKQTHASIRSFETLPQNPEDIAKYVAKKKLYLLKAEIDVRKHTDVKVLPDCEALWVECLQQELTKSVSDLRETVSDIKADKKKLEEKIKNIQETIDRQLQFQKALQQKITTLSSIPDISKDSQYNATMARSKKIRAHLDEVSKQMNTFISVHFPLPSTQELDQQSQGLPLTAANIEELLSMAQIIQKLIGQWTRSRHSPYVSVKGFWPPYLELLLRMGVAERHPQDSTLVRMQDFT